MSTQKELATQSAHILREAGHVVYFAGGAVRDQLLGQTPKDYDLATSARPDEVQALFPKSDAIGKHFGVIIIKGAGETIEVATFRTDGSYKDGRRPDSIEFSSPEKDAQRRDFTINGLFQDPLTKEIIDHVGGRTDLDAKILRAIGNPKDRFEEDALRLLRAIRFATTTGFEIESQTWIAIQECAPLLSQISPERIRDEFSRIIIAPDRGRGLDLLVESGLIKEFLPEVIDLQGCEQPPQWHPEGDVYVHTRIALSLLDSPPLPLALAVLFHDIGKPATQTWDAEAERLRFNSHDKIGAQMAEKILRRLRYSNQTTEDVTFMVSRHMRFMHVREMRTAKLKRFMSAETFSMETELHRVDCDSSNGLRDNYDFVRNKGEDFAKEPLIPKPLLTGHDLIHDFEIAPGPKIGKILYEVQTEQLEGRLSDKEAAYQFVKETLSTMSNIPTEYDDPINAKILSVSEDLVSGFQQDPFSIIAEESGVGLNLVLERIRAMLEAGVIRRVRQTMLATKLAHGALVAWRLPEEKLNDAFDFMAKKDPFSGHVVIRSTDGQISGSGYRLWTTLKVPQGESLEEHGEVLKRLVGAEEFILMPANGVFALGVGHVRRKGLEPGAKLDVPAEMMTTTVVDLTQEEWDVLLALKEELGPDEIIINCWDNRAKIAGVTLERFFEVARILDNKKVIGRFSTFLEHVKPSDTGKRVTRFNGLFHWAVPKGREMESGGEVGRHHCMTHAYWREGGPKFGDVNIMGVVHGTEKDKVLEHKAAIDQHLESVGIPVSYTNVFWGGRSEIKPSEISPKIYREWHEKWANKA
ncbi:MAG: HDIG domain-containing protein [Akkermansiaceae bacterium]|nr:HDIG domain-containing protein [Akkermansiaceae bacterium]